MVKMPVSYADSAWLVHSKLTKCLLSHSRDHQSMAHLPQLSSAGDHAESCRAHEKRYSFCAGCSVAIKELARSHSTDTEVIDRAGRLPGKQDSVRESNRRLPHHAFKESSRWRGSLDSLPLQTRGGISLGGDYTRRWRPTRCRSSTSRGF